MCGLYDVTDYGMQLFWLFYPSCVVQSLLCVTVLAVLAQWHATHGEASACALPPLPHLWNMPLITCFSTPLDGKKYCAQDG